MAGRLISLYSSKGGVGRTFLAVNLAVGLRLETREKTLLVDMGLPLSLDAAKIMDLKGVGNLDSALAAADKVTPAMLKSFATPHAGGIDVLGLSGGGQAAAAPSPAALEALFGKLLAVYGWVVADLGPGYGPVQEKMLDLSSMILMPAVPDPLALEHTQADLAFLMRRNYPSHVARLVFNRAGENPRITRQVVEAMTGREVLAVIPHDKDVWANMSGGRTYPKDHPLHETAKAFDSLAHAIVKALAQDTSASTPGDGQEVPPEERDLDLVKQAVHQKLLETYDLKYSDMRAENDPARLQELHEDLTRQVILILDQEVQIRSRQARDVIVREVLQDVLGLGPLEDLLADPGISEIMVNRFDTIFVERRGKIEPSTRHFLSESHLMRIIERIVAPLGRKIDTSTPMVDARLSDGSRVNAIVPPLAIKGAVLTIRKFPERKLTSKDLIDLGSLGPQMEEFLRAAVLSRLNVLISGGTGSGKTTLLNILSEFIPSEERIITVEDSAELKLVQPHVITLEGRPPNIEGKGEVTIRDLVRNCLRMRPDRIVVGECRGSEALDMLQAMNTGHDGSLTTIHANNAREALSRLETLVLFAGFDLPTRVVREQITGALDLIVQIKRFKDGKRRIVQISEVTGMEADIITLGDVFSFRQEPAPEGEVRGVFVATGYVPRCLARFEERGVSVPREIFWAAESGAAGGVR
jgi:septum site-determining protein MinD